MLFVFNFLAYAKLAVISYYGTLGNDSLVYLGILSYMSALHNDGIGNNRSLFYDYFRPDD